VIWSLFIAILLIFTLIPQGALICHDEWSAARCDLPGTAIEIVNSTDPALNATLEDSKLPLDELVRMVEIDTSRYVDGHPRLLPVGVNTTLAHRVGDCTDLALLRTEILRQNGVSARPVHGIMLWDTNTFRTRALHFELFGKGIAVHDWVELDGGRTLGAYERQNGIRCIKIGDGVCFQQVFMALGYL
jgi:hypothetical protein